jgi:hypothetical protein
MTRWVRVKHPAGMKLFPTPRAYLIISEKSKVDAGNCAHGERESLTSKAVKS